MAKAFVCQKSDLAKEYVDNIFPDYWSLFLYVLNDVLEIPESDLTGNELREIENSINDYINKNA